MTQRPEDILQEIKDQVWPIIQEFLTQPGYCKEFAIPEKYGGDVDFVYETINEYPLRKGKYVRPALLYLACMALGGNKEIALKAAAAMQISEEWILITDDFEDDSKLRRGKPTLHRQFSPQLAVNAADALHAVMWRALFETNKLTDRELGNKFVDEFYKMISRTIIGQGVEIKWKQENKFNISDEDWFFIADSKTSYYTIAGPLRLGAILADSSQANIEVLTEFGVKMGRCFQLTDDLLDLTSDFNGLKKQMGNDIYEGKRTLILGHVLRNAEVKDTLKIKFILNKSKEKITQADVDEVINLMKKYKSIEYAKDIAAKLRDDALELLNKKMSFIKNKNIKNQLITLTNFILERKY